MTQRKVIAHDMRRIMFI